MITKTKEEIREIIAQAAVVEEKDLLDDDKNLKEDLGMYELDLVEITLAIEEKCRLTTMISVEDIKKWETVGDIMKYLVEKGVINERT